MRKWVQVRALVVPMLVTITTFASCVTTPETHRRQLNFVPESQMNSMGMQAYSEMKKTEKISTDAKLNEQVAEIGKRIAAASGKDYKWEFTVFDSKEVNAFCLPGGKVGVYTGLVPIAKTNAGLAAVMGHEVAHAILKHSAERASQQLVMMGGLIAADAAMKDSKSKGMMMAALGLGAQFGVMLPYSRKHEAEADEVGLTYMAKAGYDPAEAVELWKRMGKAGGATPPEILSTHPNPESRVRELASQQGRVRSAYESSQKIPTAPIGG